jgi:hypothetical protein
MTITVLTLAVAHPVLTLSLLGVISLPYFHPAKLVQMAIGLISSAQIPV